MKMTQTDGEQGEVGSRIALIFRTRGTSHKARQFSALNPRLIPFATGGDEIRYNAALDALRVVAFDGEFVNGVHLTSLREVEFASGENPPIEEVQYHFFVVDVEDTDPDPLRLLPDLYPDTKDQLRLRFMRAIEVFEEAERTASNHRNANAA